MYIALVIGMKIIYSSTLLLLLLSCGEGSSPLHGSSSVSSKSAPAKAQDYSYEFKKQGCTTGEQKFPTLLIACNGLKNESLNNKCAKVSREILFKNADCPGDFS